LTSAVVSLRYAPTFKPIYGQARPLPFVSFQRGVRTVPPFFWLTVAPSWIVCGQDVSVLNLNNLSKADTVFLRRLQHRAQVLQFSPLHVPAKAPHSFFGFQTRMRQPIRNHVIG
jgi:hypothetical protein